MLVFPSLPLSLLDKLEGGVWILISLLYPECIASRVMLERPPPLPYDFGLAYAFRRIGAGKLAGASPFIPSAVSNSHRSV